MAHTHRGVDRVPPREGRGEESRGDQWRSRDFEAIAKVPTAKRVDYPVVQGALLLAAAIFLILTFLVDITYGLIDPRIRVQ